jgi:tetratricopeptide (TPR) repeat protein
MRRLSAVLGTTICLSTLTIAHADEAADKRRGRTLWEDAMKQYDLGAFEEAIKTYEEAYRLLPNPQILNNLGQAERQLHNYERAIFYFRSFLRYQPNATNRPAIEQLIIELQGLDKAQKNSAEHPPDTVHTPPALPAATQPALVVEDRRWYQDPIGWTLVGAGLVAIGVGAGFLILSNGLSDDAKTATDQSHAQSLLDSSHTFQVAGGVTIGVGAALVAGGVVKMVLYDKGPHTDPKVSVALGLDGIHLSGTF